MMRRYMRKLGFISLGLFLLMAGPFFFFIQWQYKGGEEKVVIKRFEKECTLENEPLLQKVYKGDETANAYNSIYFSCMSEKLSKLSLKLDWAEE